MTGRVLARLYDSSYPEIEGTWRWSVYVDAQGRETFRGGACATGTEARQTCESLIPDWLGGKMDTRRR